MRTGRFPLFKGATRVPTRFGVPVVPLMGMGIAVVCIGILFGPWWYGLALPGWALMAQITRADDRAFRVVWLWAQTKLVNRLYAPPGDLWGASSYSLTDGRRRAWESKELRWGG